MVLSRGQGERPDQVTQGDTMSYTIKANRSTVHIAGLEERTTSTQGEEAASARGHVAYYAQSACAGLTRSGHRMETLGSYEGLAEAIRRAEQATWSISGRKVCKTCLAAATSALEQQG
jgi:hypothetical protein